MFTFNRRNFIKASGLTVLPALLPLAPAQAAAPLADPLPAAEPVVRLFNDGIMLDPGEYIAELQKIHASKAIERDRYGTGGTVEALEKKFCEITGKEKTVYMPSGTMANQLAIAVLSGDNKKVFVQDTSHVYRDEGDAAQSVFNKRLMPLISETACFTADQLKSAIDGLSQQEAFKTGVGVVSIENPVRRSDGRHVPLAEIKKISEYCRANGIKLHLDGARIYMASAWSGVSIKEYASYFDTVYISLYKYLGASSGAVLCGDKPVMEKMQMQIKVHGGTIYSNWVNAAMALDRLYGFEDRLQRSIARFKEIETAINQLKTISIKPFAEGTNIYDVQLAKEIDGKKLQQELKTSYNVLIAGANAANKFPLYVNESLLFREPAYMINAISESLKKAKG